MLQITDLTYRIGGRLLLDQASVTVPDGHRVALVGRNGTGKTTLLRLISGELQPDGGSITLSGGSRIGIVAQEVPSSGDSLLDTVLAADMERSALLAEAETATDPMRIAEIHTRLADIQAHSAEARAGQILAGLGFDADAQRRPCRDFSGGWRMRVALAAMLFSEPDLLLLDEPTNHLDFEATIWLENYLRGYPHTIVMVSHDRELLNKLPTTIIHLDRNKLVSYSGNYETFEKTRQARLEHQEAARVKQQAQRAHIQAFVDRFRYKASKARQAQSRLKMLERMEPIVAVVEEGTTRFDFPSPEPLAPPLLALDKVAAGYDGKVVLNHLNIRIDMDDRIALLGANGNGKSTLAKLLAQRIEPLNGTVRRSPKLRIGYFAQHQAEELDLSLTAVEQCARIMPEAPLEKVRAHLGRFGFPQAKADTRIADMSGGEKARLLFALMSRDAPNILILDEPTNHLDLDSRQALIEAINGFEGAVILISHDAHLIELTADRLWLVRDGTCRAYDGDLEDYRRLLLETARAERSAARQERSDIADRDAGPNRKDQRRASAQTRAALAPLKRKADEQEKLIARLTEQRTKLMARMADPTLYEGPPDAVTKLQIELGEIEKRLGAAEEAWLEALEALETASAELE